MKKTLKILVPAIAAATLITFAVGCDDNSSNTLFVAEDAAPQPPQGVTSITGDGRVTIVWSGLWESDIVEYVVGWNDSLLGEYTEVGRVSANPRPGDNRYGFVDTDATNGTTYFYAVWAIDGAGQASPPSLEAVFDTPRPEGTVDLFSNAQQPTLSGFDLSTGQRLPDSDPEIDVFVDEGLLIDGIDTTVIYYLNTADNATDIQDLGYTDSFDDIDWAPAVGWSDLRFYELIAGHTYVIWTWDQHYAKMRVNTVDRVAHLVNFDWAYQLADTTNQYGNRELIGPPPTDNNGTTISDRRPATDRPVLQ